MPGARAMRLVESTLRCYPAGWRRRHGDEAAEIASLLIRDGTPAYSVVFSYLIGAARVRLAAQPRRRLGVAIGALLLAVCSLGVPLALVSSAPANAASVTHSRAAHPRPAAPGHDGSRPAHPRPGEGRGAPDRCARDGRC